MVRFGELRAQERKYSRRREAQKVRWNHPVPLMAFREVQQNQSDAASRELGK